MIWDFPKHGSSRCLVRNIPRIGNPPPRDRKKCWKPRIMHWIFSRTPELWMLSWNHASHNANLSKLESYTNKNNGRHLWAYSTNKPSSFRGPDRAGGCKQLRRMDVQFHWYSFLKITSNKQQPFNHAWSSKRWNQLKSNKHVPDHVPDKEMRLDDRLRGERCCVFLAEVPL